MRTTTQNDTMAPNNPANLAPATIAGAVRVALADGRALLGDGAYAFDWRRWHRRDKDGKCTVCAAGAVMANRFNVTEGVAHTRAFGEAWGRALKAIDAVRSECFGHAYKQMYPRSRKWGDPGTFDERVWAALEGAENPHQYFASAKEFAKCLDYIETTVLPVIERVETAMPQRRCEDAAPARAR